MVHFESKEQMKQVFDEFWSRAVEIESVFGNLKRSNILVRFDVEEPDAVMTIDFKNPGPDGEIGSLTYETCENPDIVVWSKSDVTNKFWQGKLRTSVAMVKGEVKLTGSVTKGLGLIGTIKPLYEVYIQVLKDLGLERMLV